MLLARIKPLLLMNRRVQQSGFTAVPYYAGVHRLYYSVLAIGLLAEIHLEFGRPLDALYIDLKKAAFDSVDRAPLWRESVPQP